MDRVLFVWVLTKKKPLPTISQKLMVKSHFWLQCITWHCNGTIWPLCQTGLKPGIVMVAVDIWQAWLVVLVDTWAPGCQEPTVTIKPPLNCSPGQITGLSLFRDCVLSPGRAGVPLVDGEEGSAPSGLLAPINGNQYPQRVHHQLPESPVDVSREFN